MDKNSTSAKRIDKPAPSSFRVRTETLSQGDLLIAAGKHWPLSSISFRIGRKEMRPRRLLQGTFWNQFVVPDAQGNFLVEFITSDLEPGKYVLEAFTKDEKLLLKERVIIQKRPVPGEGVRRETINKYSIRHEAYFNNRINPAKGLTRGIIQAARKSWNEIHGNYPKDKGGVSAFSLPVKGGCNWTPMGPAPLAFGPEIVFTNHSGRALVVVVHPLNPSTLLMGTASGGIWKSMDDGLTWVPKTDDKYSLSVAALTFDPINPDTVYAGTGEYVPGTTGGYHGNGLLKSVDAGETWIEIGVNTFTMAEISRICVDPADAQKVYVSASNGIWESTNGGNSWTQLAPDPCTDLVLSRDPANPGAKLTAGFSDLGIYSSFNFGMGWPEFTPLVSPNLPPSAPTNSRRITFGVCASLPQHIYACFTESGAGNLLASVAHSSDYGKSWQDCALPAGYKYQAVSNMCVLPHPKDPEIVYVGVVHLFKSVNGGKDWTNLTDITFPRIHVDIHGLAYGPVDHNKVYVASDGGLFFSPDLGSTWFGRNQDISNMQLYDFNQHPQYEAIMTAGSLDNGGFHYSGAPIWYRSWATKLGHTNMEGDVDITAIDPFNPYFHYYGISYFPFLQRSADGGRTFPLEIQKPFTTPSTTPFYHDPRSAGVIFIGGDVLMRCTGHGDSTDSIASGFKGLIRSIAFHPTDVLVQYFGTGSGAIYRVQGPASGDWNPSTVTTSEITYTGLPESSVSSLAVDPSGNIWVTFSSLEGKGDEFSNPHVFYLESGSDTWQERSNGLAISNPVNTIVIDPQDAAKVYCGGDRGVYAWNSITNSWKPFDQGLPNAGIQSLKIHGPSRKLRAGTYGRGVWERHLDPGKCSDHYLYMRTHIADAGSEPAADGVAHPYLQGHLCWHWQSPDIIVDGASQTTNAAKTVMEVYDKIVHHGGVRGSNKVYILVHNKGPFKVTNVRVRVFWTMASGGLPAFSDGILSDTFEWNPDSPTDWNPIGAAFEIPEVEPGTSRLAVWPKFVIPSDAPAHVCLIAFVTSTEDPLEFNGITNPDELVVQNRKVALKNLNLDGVPFPENQPQKKGLKTTPKFASLNLEAKSVMALGFSAPRFMRMNGLEIKGTLYQPTVYTANLPDDAVIIFAADKQNRSKLQLDEQSATEAEKAALAMVKRHKAQFNGLDEFDLTNLVLREAKFQSQVKFGVVKLDKAQPMDIAVWIWSEKWDADEDYYFDILQQQGLNNKGGFSVTLKGAK